MKINLERLKKNIIGLGKIGFTEHEGITRSAFTKEYEEANIFIKKLMENIKLDVNEDSVGNLFGKLEGNNNVKSILIGSHIDTVPCGGLFDGNLGVLAAIECIQTLIENNYKSNFNLEVVSFIGEEGTEVGGTFGSRCFAGNTDFNEKEYDYLSTVNISKADVTTSRRDPETLRCYLELHIEQGNILNTEDVSIGIVKGIVGIAHYKAKVTGKANHAGTTPMNLRDDALVKASKIIICVNDIVNNLGSPTVGTVGYIKAYPGAINVIPGKVEFTIELRDMDKERIQQAIDLIKEKCISLDLSIENLLYEEEVHLDEKLQKYIKESCKDLDYSYKFMYSGAGHDANPISKITQSGMLFVPSKDGISHSPLEWTDWKDVEIGANTLLNTILKIDKDI
ncbi:MAG: M20 family metallo-hydrolase [Sedimentibacter sp.]